MKPPAPEDAGSARAGFLLLFSVIAAHALLETARDTLFLTGLAADNLPWAYLAIAVLALATAAWSRGLAARLERRGLLAGTLLVGATVTVGFWRLSAASLPGTLFGLYVWTGLLATSLTVQLWVLLGEPRVTRHPERTFPLVALGGLLGSLFGAGLAAGLLTVASPRTLLLAAAAILSSAAVLPGLLPRTPTPAKLAPPAGEAQRLLARDRYVRQLLLLPLVAATATTGIDFVFKSAAKSALPPDRLGFFFATFYAAVSLVALLVQGLATPRALHRLGAGRSQALLPSLTLAAAALLAAVGGVVPAVLLKGADGSLRHSLHRTGNELLFVQLSRSARELARALAGGLGQRSGQALGSLLILLCVSLRLEARTIAAGVAALCAAWLAVAALAGRAHRRRARERRRPAPPTGASKPREIGSL